MTNENSFKKYCEEFRLKLNQYPKFDQKLTRTNLGILYGWEIAFLMDNNAITKKEDDYFICCDYPMLVVHKRDGEDVQDFDGNLYAMEEIVRNSKESEIRYYPRNYPAFMEIKK
jgi:histidinol phosphatase-like PHP family hydrolase